MFQKLPITLALEKAHNTSENLLNEIRQIIYSLYREKEVTKKVCNNIILKWILYLWILKIVGHVILVDYYSQSYR